MAAKACRISFIVGNFFSRCAVATRASLSDGLKYSASQYRMRVRYSVLIGEPDEEGLQSAERRIDRRRGKWLAWAGANLLGKIGFECLRLFDVEFPKIAVAVVAIEAFQRLGHGVNRSLVAPLHFAKKFEVAPLYTLVLGMSFHGWLLSVVKSPFREGLELSPMRGSRPYVLLSNPLSVGTEGGARSTAKRL
jgi:hypothetical protein